MKYHYAYRISDKLNNKHYYGVRSCNREPKNDLGIKYFSSSTDKYFINTQQSSPDQFKYKILKLFATREEANLFEIKIHAKFDVGANERFYNKCKATTTGFCVQGRKFGNRHTLDYLSRCHLHFGDVSGKNNGMYGSCRKGEENPFYGKTHSKTSIEKISKSKNKIIILENGETTTLSIEGGKNAQKLKIQKNGKKKLVFKQ